MGNSGATLSMVLALIGGAAVTAGLTERCGMAGDLRIPASFAFELEDEHEAQRSMFPGERPQDEIGPAPLTDVTPREEAGYLDTGPVEEDLEGAALEDALASDDLSQSDRAPADGGPANTSPGADSEDSYRFEYPDDQHGDEAQLDDEADCSPWGYDYGYDERDYDYDGYHGNYVDEQDSTDGSQWGFASDLEDGLDDGEYSEDWYQGQYTEEPWESESSDFGYESDEDFGYDYDGDFGNDFKEEYEYEFEEEYEYEFDEEGEQDFDGEYEYYQEHGDDDENEYEYDNEGQTGLSGEGKSLSGYEAELDQQLEEESGEGFEYGGQEPYGYDEADADYYEYEFYGEDIQPITVPEDNPEADGPEPAEADGAATWQPEWQYMPQSGVELFAPHPAELLAQEDQETLKRLVTLCEEPSAVRRAAFHNHLEGLGLEGIDFCTRFEDVTGIEVLGLADDLPGAAAFLAAFRLARRGELGMSEAINLCERSLQRPSWSWIEGVDEITADEFEDWHGPQDEAEVAAPDWSDATSIDNPVVNVMVSLASRSLAGVGGAVRSVARRLAELDWPSFSSAPAEGQAAGPIGPRESSIQR